MSSGRGAKIGPVVVAVRDPSRSGKTTMVEHLVRHFEARNVRVAYVKRTHHLLDLPEKSSGRVWTNQPTAMLLRADDRLQITLPPVEREVQSLLRHVPNGIDLVLVETHEPEPFPTLLARSLESAPDERVLERWAIESIAADWSAAAAAIEQLLPTHARPQRPNSLSSTAALLASCQPAQRASLAPW